MIAVGKSVVEFLACEVLRPLSARYINSPRNWKPSIVLWPGQRRVPLFTVETDIYGEEFRDCIEFRSVSVKIIDFQYGRLLPATDFSILIVYFTLFSIACIAQCVFISTLFSQTNVASVSTAVIFLLLFFPYQISIRTQSVTFVMLTVSFNILFN